MNINLSSRSSLLMAILLFMLVFTFLWRAAYEHSTSGILAGMTLKDTVWYLMMSETIELKKLPETGCRPRGEDTDALESLEKKRIKEWFPINPLYYSDGTPFKEKQQYESLDQLFTRRNLQAVAWLREAIEHENSPMLRKLLMGKRLPP